MNMPKLRVCVTCDRVTCPQQETPIPQRPTRGFRRNRTWTRGKNWVHATDLSRVLANTVFSVDRTRKAQPVPAAAGRGGPDCSTQVARRYQHSLAPHEPAKPLPTQDASRAAVSRLPGATADRTVRRAGRASVRGEGHKQDNAQDNTDGQQDEAHLVARAALAALRGAQLPARLGRAIGGARDVGLDVVQHHALVIHQHRQVLRGRRTSFFVQGTLRIGYVILHTDGNLLSQKKSQARL